MISPMPHRVSPLDSELGGVSGLANLPGIPSAANQRVSVRIGAELRGPRGPLPYVVTNPLTGRPELDDQGHPAVRPMTLRDVICDTLEANTRFDESVSAPEKRARYEIACAVSAEPGDEIELAQSQVDLLRERIGQVGFAIAYGAAYQFLRPAE